MEPLKFSLNTPSTPVRRVMTGTPTCCCRASAFSASSYWEIMRSGVQERIFSASAACALGPPTPQEGSAANVSPYAIT